MSKTSPLAAEDGSNFQIEVHEAVTVQDLCAKIADRIQLEPGDCSLVGDLVMLRPVMECHEGVPNNDSSRMLQDSHRHLNNDSRKGFIWIHDAFGRFCQPIFREISNLLSC